MSSTNSVGRDPLSSLANQLFTRVDANKDGQLSADEFQSFLTGLLKKVDTASTTTSTTTTTTSDTTSDTTSSETEAPKVYQPMLGFDYTKLNTPTHTTPKYVFARATQDLTFPWDRDSRSAGLSKIAEYAKSHGYPDTTVVGDDKLNFGDGAGDVDVLTGDGQWWWGPTGH